MFYRFVGYPPDTNTGGAAVELMLDVSKVTAYYSLGRLTVVRCDGADFNLTTPFEAISNALAEYEGLHGGVLGDA